MHIIKPVWLTHGGERKDFEVYSCDVSPDGKRLVTAAGGTNEPPPVENWRTIRRLIGHDNDVQDLGWSCDSSILVSVGLDSKVVVWSGHTFEKLKTISNHQSHVKGITFDPANKYFATAGDDRTVRIFRFTSPAPNSTAHDQMNNFVLEQTISAPFVNSPLTTYFRRCSWSPDGNHIAAANAVNGPVSSVAIVNRGSWDGDINLIGHEGPVEVCAFSPRLYDSQPASKAPVDKQGHPIHTLVTVIACAGADKSLSIWITSNPRPIVVTQDLAAKAISDLSWSPDGKCLFVTALDGTILCVRFEENELGKPMPFEENEKSLTKFGTNRRGAGIVESTNGLLLEEKSKAGEIKGVEGRMGALMGDGHASTDPGVNGESANLPSNAATPAGASTPIGGSAIAAQKGQPNGSVNGEQDKRDPYAAKLERLKQRPTYTKDGKKRIQPLLVSGAGGAESSLPQSRLVAASMSNAGRPDGPDSILDLSKPFDGLPKGGLAALLFGNKRKFAQIEGADEEGSIEKRVALTSENGSVPILANAIEGLRPAQPGDAQGGPRPIPEFIRPAVVNPCMAVSQLRLAVPKIRSHILQAIDSSGNPTNPADTAAAAAAGSNSGPLPRAKVDILFEARNPPASSGRHIDREPVRITLTRGDQPLWQDFIPKTVLLVTGNRKLWAAASEDGSVYIWTPAGRRLLNALVLEAQPVILECNGPWVLCINAVGMCYVWNVTTLSSPHPPISLAPILDAAVHTLAPNATAAPAINAARLNSEGRVIVTLSNGDGYSYSPTLYTWQRMSEGWWAVGSQYWNTKYSTVGDLQAITTSSQSAAGAAPGSRQDGETRTAVSAGVIPFLERNTTDETLVRGRGFFLQRLIKVLLSREGFEGFEAGVSVAHLENRVAAALALGAKEEFRLYLSMYAKRLGAEGAKMKAEELLEGLLGGIFEDGGDEVDGDLATKGIEGTAKSKKLSVAQGGSAESGPGTWNNGSDKLCGWPRRTLLNEVVLALGKHRDLQRVTVPYAQLLGILDGDQQDQARDQGQNQDHGEDAMVT
ncbi:histone transcription regulator slm9 [Histoplasma capsulatum G186AR]|uniref:Protein HIR n=1 Tax=Ajellomyces capsulatus (strain G186AR / H82 / ATCC MYA-2454 / RMSCC 2432) TaxID=447093 RepID=C0NJH6_AJECG|nr:histone transcription regulator slm9 [Histoplasma capsulatum G186AR]EEH08017.1 histone transcription regulator slm9 [Histoplasma capsulatum G186AR]